MVDSLLPFKKQRRISKEVPSVARKLVDACTLTVLLAGLLLTSACSSDTSHSKATPISDDERAQIEAEVLDLERQFNEAYESNDLDRYWAFYADDLTQFLDSGRLTLEEYKKEWTALVEGGEGVIENRTEDVRVRISPMGDAAVVTYPVFARYRGTDGIESANQYYETNVWFRQDGGWKLVHLHFSSAVEQEEP